MVPHTLSVNPATALPPHTRDQSTPNPAVLPSRETETSTDAFTMTEETCDGGVALGFVTEIAPKVALFTLHPVCISARKNKKTGVKANRQPLRFGLSHQ